MRISIHKFTVHERLRRSSDMYSPARFVNTHFGIAPREVGLAQSVSKTDFRGASHYLKGRGL